MRCLVLLVMFGVSCAHISEPESTAKTIVLPQEQDPIECPEDDVFCAIFPTAGPGTNYTEIGHDCDYGYMFKPCVPRKAYCDRSQYPNPAFGKCSHIKYRRSK